MMVGKASTTPILRTTRNISQICSSLFISGFKLLRLVLVVVLERLDLYLSESNESKQHAKMKATQMQTKVLRVLAVYEVVGCRDSIRFIRLMTSDMVLPNELPLLLGGIKENQIRTYGRTVKYLEVFYFHRSKDTLYDYKSFN
jgi:hypothetical protein